MQRTDEFHGEDLIDLGAASVETKGGSVNEIQDTPGSSTLFREQPGLSTD